MLIESVDFSGGRAVRITASEPTARIAAAQITRDVAATHTDAFSIVAGAINGRQSR